MGAEKVNEAVLEVMKNVTGGRENVVHTHATGAIEKDVCFRQFEEAGLKQYDNLELLEELAANGKIDGVEVYHYTADEETRNRMLEIAQKYNLIVTGGSDFHGLYNAQPSHLGSNTTTKENLDRIIRLSNKRGTEN
jgi:sugar phosphate isomerase/epimerase